VSQPFVSIVVPTWNRAELLRDCLKSLLDQDYPHDRYEIIVVDDGSTDSTTTIMAGFKGYQTSLVYARKDHGGLNSARNHGIALARGELVCFFDDDALAPQPWLPAMVAGYRRWPEAGCYGGPIKSRFEGPVPRLCGRESFGQSELNLGGEERPVRRVSGGNMALTCKALATAGKFLESLPLYYEDHEWEQRHLDAGGQVFYLPEAWIWHRHPAAKLRLWSLVRNQFRRGTSELGYLQHAGQAPTLRAELSAILIVLGHALRRRCAWGILAAAMHLGRIWGILRG
jgi:glycosyltransferase involved in cell wall biosynthesis